MFSLQLLYSKVEVTPWRNFGYCIFFYIIIYAKSLQVQAQSSCSINSFSVSTPDTVCNGLTSQPGIQTADQCIDLCCSLGADACGVWQFCAPSDPCYTGKSCFTGPRYGTEICNVISGSGWIGGMRQSQTCDANSFGKKTNNTQCFGLTAFPLATTEADCVSACCNEGPEACSTWQFCPDGAPCQPQPFSKCWLGQPTLVNCQTQGGAGWIGGIRGTPPERGSYFAIVPVNTTSGLPLSSAIRHCNSVVSADPFTLNPDFQFKVLNPASDVSDPAAISLQPYNYFFDFIGAVQDDPFGVMHITNTDTKGVSPQDLSWIVTPGLQNANFYSLLSMSLNRSGQYLTMSSNPTVPCTYNNPTGDITTALPSSTVAANGTVISQTFMFVKLTVTQNIVWTSEHHDAQNSGFSAWDGPGETTSVCLEQMIKDDPQSSRSAKFYSSGITSAVDGWWFGGDSEDTLYMLEDLLVSQQNDETWQSWTLNLTQVLGVSTSAAPYGIVGSPAYLFPSDYNQQTYDATKNMLFVSSSNGWVAALNPLFCYTGGKKPIRSVQPTRSQTYNKKTNRNLRGEAYSLPFLVPSNIESAPVSDSPNGAQWMVFKDINALYGCPNGCHVNGSYATWPECQASCWEDFQSKGSLGEPDGCVSWVWHNLDTPDWSLKCLHGVNDGLIEMRSEGGHVSGMLSLKAPGPQCVVWKRQISTSGLAQPSYSSVQLVKYRNYDIVLVSETHAELDASGILHAYSAINGSELWFYKTIDDKGLKGVIPAQMTTARDPNGRYIVLAHGTKIVLLDLDVCSASNSIACIPLTVFEGAADDFVSSVSVSPQFGDRLFVHSSTGALWKINIIWNNAIPSFSSTAAWRCVYSRSNTSTCSQVGSTILDNTGKERPIQDYGGVIGGFYQPTTKTQRDELHSEIRLRHIQHFGPLGGGLDSIGDVAHVLRLATELPRLDLLSIRTKSGYQRLGSNGKPRENIDDFNGPYPFSTPGLYEDFIRGNTLIAFIDSPIDGSNSGLFVIDDTFGNPITISGTLSTPFAVFNTTLQDGITFAEIGRSRSSPAWDRQRNVYFGSDMDLGGGSTTFPALLCVDELANVKWALGLGEEDLSQVGSASVVVTQGPRGDNRAYMVSSDGVSTIVENPTGISCPTSNALYTCSGHGDCDCATGNCKCNGCWTGIDCSVFDSSFCEKNGGSCNSDGTCLCGDACHTGTTCEVNINCGPLGTCSPLDGSCLCSGCVETNSWGVCNIYNTTSSYCNGQQCTRDGSCLCDLLTCKSGPTCSSILDCTNGGVCSIGTGCSCDGTCFNLGSNGLCSIPIDCGEGGVCTTGGVCSCLPCWSLGSDNKCSLQETCNGHGNCKSSNGNCDCNPGYSSNSKCATCTDCFSGSNCNARTGDTTRCSSNGICMTSTNGSFNQCVCNNGYSGSDCSISPSSSNSSVNTGNASAGSIAAGILIPLLLLAIGGFVYTRKISLQSLIEYGEKTILGTGKKYSPIKANLGTTRSGGSEGSGISPVRNLSGFLVSGTSTSTPEITERASIINAARAKVPKQTTFTDTSPRK
jgi:hypothetical protein